MINYFQFFLLFKVIVYFDVEQNQDDIFYSEFLALSECLRAKMSIA
jgi:hypothetical protein